mmetsp:Transcript_10491/g.16589  ORF Transcript_10491/g.16589 Transcript_10491/m.16589 type:complete len:341 (-) Transcript_10491:647-1669(-)
MTCMGAALQVARGHHKSAVRNYHETNEASINEFVIITRRSADFSVLVEEEAPLGDLDGAAGEPLVRLAHLEGNESLDKSGPVAGTGGALVLDHLLGKFSEVLSVGVGETLLDVEKLLDLAEHSINLNHVSVLFLGDLFVVSDAGSGVRAGHGVGAGTRVPVDLGTFFLEQVHGANTVGVLLLDQTGAEELCLLSRSDVELGGLNRNNHISVGLLGSNELVEVRLAGLDGRDDILLLVPTLRHITLNLPSHLDRVRDVDVKGEVKAVDNILIEHRVESLDDDDVVGVDKLHGVNLSGVVVVDGLLDGPTLLESLELVSHQLEVVGLHVKSRNTSVLPSGAV